MHNDLKKILSNKPQKLEPRTAYLKLPEVVTQYVMAHPGNGSLYLFLFRMSYGFKREVTFRYFSMSEIGRYIHSPRTTVNNYVRELRAAGAIDNYQRHFHYGIIYKVLLPVIQGDGSFRFVPFYDSKSPFYDTNHLPSIERAEHSFRHYQQLVKEGYSDYLRQLRMFEN